MQAMRKTPFAPGEYYHLYNRGTNKMDIFLDHKDYSRFQKLLFLCNQQNAPKYSDIETSPGKIWEVEKGETLVNIGLYCLMPNHFHILIKAKEEKDTSKFLLKLLTSYSTYFNKKHDRTGSLFQGKTKSKHITDDNYFKYLFSYIHLNPVKLINPTWKNSGISNTEETVDFLKNYSWSSLLDYQENNRSEYKILDKDEFPAYFLDPKERLEEITEWLNYEKTQ